jgi:hypothetical protein
MPLRGFGYVLLALGILRAHPASGSVPEFFQQLCTEFSQEYSDLHVQAYNSFCRAFELDSASTENRRTYAEIAFIHDILTGTAALDCARGGLLGIPYFWHWIHPNPRHSIVLLPDSIPLSEVTPPKPYTQYKSYADLDRVPLLFLSDLFSREPKYAHPDCGSFYTFGWCSEREMAYVTIMDSFGKDAKIRQSGIHTWSVVRCAFKHLNGSEVLLEAHVDNTFDTLRWETAAAEISLAEWYLDTGAGTQIGWYNRMAHSPSQLAALNDEEVPHVAGERIRSLIREAIAREHGPDTPEPNESPTGNGP